LKVTRDKTMIQTSKNQRVFLEALHQYRQGIFEYAQQIEYASSIATYLFNSFARLGQANKTQLDQTTLNLLHEQLGHLPQAPSRISIPLPSGVVLSLEQALLIPVPPPGAHDVINALFAYGLHLSLENRQPSEKQGMIVKMVKFLPSIERLGQFFLTDYVDYACNAEDSERFWKTYVERVALELEKRTAENDVPQETWMLSSLLKLQELGTSALAGKKLETIKKHLERIMQSRAVENHWGFLKLLSEACKDPKMLHFTFSSPAILESADVAFHLISKCNSKEISCGLFMLQISRARKSVVREILKFFEDESIDVNGERMIEVYAQIQLISNPSKMILAIRNGLIDLIQPKLQDEPIDVLLNAIKNDARAFRQVLLLKDLVPTERKFTSTKQSELLERVTQSFFHSFTPSGVRHPLNDHLYRQGVAQAIIEQIRQPQENISETLSSFGENLENIAIRWIPNEQDLPKRHLLLSYFIGIFAHTLRIAAAELYHQEELKDRALLLYRILIAIYLKNPSASAESSGYSTINPLMSSLYPELIAEDYIEEPSMERIQQAIILMAEIEAEQFDREEIEGLLYDRKVQSNEEDDVMVEVIEKESTPLPIASSGGIDLNFKYLDDQKISTKVLLAERFESISSSMIRTYLGIDLMAYVMRKSLNLLGIYQSGTLSFSQNMILFEEESKKGNDRLAYQQVKFHPSQLAGIKIHQPLKSFYFIFGLFAMVVFALMGGHFLFAGVRGNEFGLGFLGIFFILIGLGFEAAMGALHRLGANKILLELYQQNQEKPLALYLDKKSLDAQRMLNTLLHEEAQRQERQFDFTMTIQEEPEVG
jgi:hypothetical protein